MVTTRSKSLRLTTNYGDGDVDNAATPARSGRKSKGPSGFDGGYGRYAVVTVHTFLDVLAFTLALTFLPDILRHFKNVDGPHGLFVYCETKMHNFRNSIGAPYNQNLALIGGFLGSLISFLQFISAPIIGGLSDIYGRKIIVAFSLFGLTLSYLLWSVSTTFFAFILARIIGGLFKCNPNIPLATVADISTTERRTFATAIICAVISIAPVIGGLLSSYNILIQTGDSWYTKPAIFSLFLIVVDIIVVLALFKETLPKEKRMKTMIGSWRQALAYVNVYDLFQFSAARNITFKDLKQLRTLGWVHFSYIFLYSGLEFVLSFFVSLKFGYTNVQRIWVYSGISITKAITQAFLVSRIPSESVQNYAYWTLLLTIPTFLCIGFAPSTIVLNIGISLFAVSVPYFVPCITTTVSKYGSSSQKGTILGIFQSLGALAKTFGPIVATAAYFLCGPIVTFSVGGALLLVPWSILHFSAVTKT